MNLLIAPDSFKGSLTSEDVCNAIAKGAIIANPNVNIVQIPSSDGGEGFCSSMKNIFGGNWVEREVTFPLGDKGFASFVFNEVNKTAYIELASAAGLCLVSDDKRNIMESTTYGVGELILFAVALGSKKIVVGLGGSATNDGGMGLLAALGVRFYDADGRELLPMANSLSEISSVDMSALDELSNVQFVAACDVNNPLCGPNGAANVFARQKGATDEQVLKLDDSLAWYAKVLSIDPDVPGSGAAGGVGAALISVLGAEYVSGAELLLNSNEFREAMKWADLIFTGEGNTDSQTLQGKLVSKVAALAKKNNITVFVLSGGLSDGYEELFNIGVTKIYCLSDMGYDIEYCIANAQKLIIQKTIEIFRNI